MFSSYPDLLTINQLQEALGIGKSTAYRLVGDGSVKYLRIGKSIKIPKKYLIDFVFLSCYNGGKIIDSRLDEKGVER